VISAKNNQINQNENLRKLTNHVYDHLATLRDSRIPLIKPIPNDANEWISTGLRQNYKLLAAKFSMENARENIKAKASGAWPVLAVQATSGATHNNGGVSNIFAPGLTQQSNIALTMNFPIYQGGLVESRTKQAQFDFQTSSEQMEQAYRAVAVNSQISFNSILTGISKVKADRQTVISQQNSVESTEAQFQVGTRVMVDVVNAQQKLFLAQQQLASDQYDLINAILNLKYLAGTLNVTDLEEINSWLNTTRIKGLPPQEKKKKH
jgi:outer membrane protein